MKEGQVATITLSRADVQKALVDTAALRLEGGPGNSKFDVSIRVHNDGSVDVRFKYTGPSVRVPFADAVPPHAGLADLPSAVERAVTKTMVRLGAVGTLNG